MGTAAQINKLSLLIKRESFMFGKPSFDVFYLVLLIQVSANLQGLVSWLFDPFKRLTLLDDLFHLCFDGSKVIFGKGMFQVEIVIETGFQGRPKGQTDSLEQPHYSSGHDVGTGMPQDSQCLGILVGENFERDSAIFRQWVVEPDHVAIDFGSQGRLGQARANVSGDKARCHRLFVLFLGTVGEGNCQHDRLNPVS